MFSTIYKQRRSFPELVGRNVEQAAAYITTLGIITLKKNLIIITLSIVLWLGFKVDILRRNDPTTKDLCMDRVRIIVDPTRSIVIQTPVVG